MSKKLPKIELQRGRYLGTRAGMDVYDSPFYRVKDVELFIKKAKKLHKEYRKLKKQIIERDILLGECRVELKNWTDAALVVDEDTDSVIKKINALIGMSDE